MSLVSTVTAMQIICMRVRGPAVQERVTVSIANYAARVLESLQKVVIALKSVLFQGSYQ